MKNTWKAVATGAAVYVTWKALRRSSKKSAAVSGSSEDGEGSWMGDALRHYAMNILIVALLKTFKERSSGNSLRHLIPSSN